MLAHGCHLLCSAHIPLVIVLEQQTTKQKQFLISNQIKACILVHCSVCYVFDPLEGDRLMYGFPVAFVPVFPT
jgi:hypothetical protein